MKFPTRDSFNHEIKSSVLLPLHQFVEFSLPYSFLMFYGGREKVHWELLTLILSL